MIVEVCRQTINYELSNFNLQELYRKLSSPLVENSLDYFVIDNKNTF